MKVIYLLNKIAKGQTPPKRVKITTGTLKDEFRIWVWEDVWYEYEKEGMTVSVDTCQIDLNDKVEIIEE